MARDRGGSDNISALIVQAGPSVAAATTAPALHATRPMLTQRPRSRRFPWLAAGVAGAGLLGVAILAVALILPDGIRGVFSGARSTPTLESTPSAAPTDVPTPSPTPEFTPTTVAPTATLIGEGGLGDGFVLEAPHDTDTVLPGEVELRWRWEGEALAVTELFQVCFVTPGESQSCGLPQRKNTYRLQATAEGTYEWWVVVNPSNVPGRESARWHFTVGPVDVDTSAITETETLTGTDSLTQTQTLTTTNQATDDLTDSETGTATPDG